MNRKLNTQTFKSRPVGNTRCWPRHSNMAASEHILNLTRPSDPRCDLSSDPADLERYYVKGQQVSVTEDLRTEFKGHRNISVFDLPSSWSRDARQKTRSAVSASVGALLNTGVGGTVYLGVSDEGKVVGLPLTGSAWTP
ncbi:uncharacterized protein LOC123502157 isoform X2 [Portunus trituberculatus]|uniref:uncharacterized protein LOC123502157 isoform X2 n=1 Tax=Portunus trituberculatus TaxID=210409 RepID=UPI001E1D0732|nr:uncharacterized protein LOC123502157 isoform X2 [Portunus trituberculatus]